MAWQPECHDLVEVTSPVILVASTVTPAVKPEGSSDSESDPRPGRQHHRDTGIPLQAALNAAVQRDPDRR